MSRKVLTSVMCLTLMCAFLLLNCAVDKKNEDSGGNNGKMTASNGDTTAAAEKNEKENGKADEKKVEEDLIPVEVTTVLTGDIASYILLSSNLETEQSMLRKATSFAKTRF
jgi:hypothetical protein